MEKLLLRLARQLDAMDEASLMSLWSKYATIVERFEPSRQWEKAALIFSMIQGKRWKNQLFNYYWALQSRPSDLTELTRLPSPGFVLEKEPETDTSRCHILPFRPKNDSPN
jgi:hypothetical protein